MFLLAAVLTEDDDNAACTWSVFMSATAFMETLLTTQRKVCVITEEAVIFSGPALALCPFSVAC